MKKENANEAVVILVLIIFLFFSLLGNYVTYGLYKDQYKYSQDIKTTYTDLRYNFNAKGRLKERRLKWR